ncbi:MAG: hypothetical protein JNM98_06145 [Rhodocyclaceae bacterium]|nr:hypothetical protein [Rhodocyclaceae bacterium]
MLSLQAPALQLSLYELAGILLAVCGFWSALLSVLAMAGLRFVVRSTEQRWTSAQQLVDARLRPLEGHVADYPRRAGEVDSAISQVREMLRAEYVAREDWIRFAANIDGRMERLVAEQQDSATALGRIEGALAHIAEGAR